MNWATFYLVCFVVGFALSAIMVFSGAGHHHILARWHLPHWGHGSAGHGGVGHVAAGHGGVAAHATAPGGHGAAVKGAGRPSPFDVSTFMAFLTWFGGTGYLLTSYSSMWDILALGIATLGGLAGAAIVFWFLVKVLMAHETILDPSDFDMVGVLGRVSSTIRPTGTGEIIFSQAGARRPSSARSEDGLAISKGQEVVVTRYEKGIAYVRPWEEVAKDEFEEMEEEAGGLNKGTGSMERS